MFTTNKKSLDAVIVDTTGIGVEVSERANISIQLIATGITSGNGVFTFEISNDQGVTWTAYNRLITNIANTNAQNDTKVASVTLSSNGSAFVFVPNGDYFGMIRVNVDRTTDGTYSAVVQSGE